MPLVIRDSHEWRGLNDKRTSPSTTLVTAPRARRMRSFRSFMGCTVIHTRDGILDPVRLRT